MWWPWGRNGGSYGPGRQVLDSFRLHARRRRRERVRDSRAGYSEAGRGALARRSLFRVGAEDDNGVVGSFAVPTAAGPFSHKLCLTPSGSVQWQWKRCRSSRVGSLRILHRPDRRTRLLEGEQSKARRNRSPRPRVEEGVLVVVHELIRSGSGGATRGADERRRTVRSLTDGTGPNTKFSSGGVGACVCFCDNPLFRNCFMVLCRTNKLISWLVI